ncbi:MAG: outer membrane beta-barrel protein [Pirellulales bacterium]
MSRYWIAILVAVVLSAPLQLRAQSGPVEELPAATTTAPGTWADDWPIVPGAASHEDGQPKTLDDYRIVPGFGLEAPPEPNDYLPVLKWLHLRHSHTHGRHIGRGGPLTDASWLNRPYYVGAELGTLWITSSIYDDITPDVDAFGGIMLGWDRDPYWGAEFQFNWATPELINEEARDAERTDSLFEWSYNLLYYPWGDATWRPYWRAGIGDTHVDFPLDDDSRHDQWMLTFPLGMGVKYPLRRWLAARAEITDHFIVGHNRLSTQHNPALTLGLEWHFGAHPRSYWPWNPSRHIW